MRLKSLTFGTLAQTPFYGPSQKVGRIPGPSVLNREFSQVKVRYLSGYVAWAHDQPVSHQKGMGFFPFALIIGAVLSAAAIAAAIIAAIAAAIAFVIALLLVPLGATAGVLSTVTTAVTGLVVKKLVSLIPLPPWAEDALGYASGNQELPDFSAPQRAAAQALSPLQTADLGAGLASIDDAPSPPHDVGQAFLGAGNAAPKASDAVPMPSPDSGGGEVPASALPSSNAASETSLVSATQAATPVTFPSSISPVGSSAEITSAETESAAQAVLAQLASQLPGVNLSKLSPKDILSIGLSLLMPKSGKKAVPPKGAQIVYEYEYQYPDGGAAIRVAVPHVVYPTDWGLWATVGGSIALAIGSGFYIRQKRRG